MVDMDVVMRAIFKPNNDGNHEIELYGQDDMLSATADPKQFLKDMSATLQALKFKDKLGQQSRIGKRGEMVESSMKKNYNRRGFMYETKYHWLNLPNGNHEFEVEWNAVGKVPHSKKDISVIFKMDLQVRNMVEVEKLVDGKKKRMYKCEWEFRNKIIYRNNVVREFINKLPFIGDTVKYMIFKEMYKSEVEENIQFVMTAMKGAIYGVINKHFT